MSEQKSTHPFSVFIQFWQDLRAVAQPYWYPTELDSRAFPEVMKSWGMLLLMLLLINAVVAVKALESFWGRYVLDIVIKEKDLDKYLQTIWISVASIIAIVVLSAFSRYVRKKVNLDWYQWLHHHILKQYFNSQAYYKINFLSKIDNPDQRLAQEIEPITNNALRFSTTFLERSINIITFIIILWTISYQIAIYLIIYTIVGNIVAIYLSQELTKINQEGLAFKADFNYSLTHVRNHAESIAFFQGEEEEIQIINRRFNQMIKNAEQRINWEKGQDLFNTAYQSAVGIFSIFILTPLFIQDQINYGEISQATYCCVMFSNALGALIAEFGTSGQFSSYVKRLAEFSEALVGVSQKPENVSTIKVIENQRLAFENVTLQTPNYEQVIVEDLSVSVQPGQGLLIVGASGRGKSSLLRAIAGLWNAGTGRLVRPPREEMLFLPQRPYIILGTLREQLLYPHTDRKMSDQQLEEVLKKVNLQNLFSRINGFDQEVRWENILSLGEQQRLAFARLLITHPSFTILDEATSALDLINEKNLYEQLQETKTTYISVGHRESLFHYHQWVLELAEDSSWQLLTVPDYQQQKATSVESTPASEAIGDILLPDQVPKPSELSATTPIKTELSHQEIQPLTDYSLATIRSRGSQGKSITTKAGIIYYYNKNRKVSKWIKTD